MSQMVSFCSNCMIDTKDTVKIWTHSRSAHYEQEKIGRSYFKVMLRVLLSSLRQANKRRDNQGPLDLCSGSGSGRIRIFWPPGSGTMCKVFTIYHIPNKYI
jgi:hypothetical protein